MVGVLFLHGTGADKKVWEAQQKFLNEKNIKNVAIDLPAHGEDIEDHFSIDKAYKKIDETLNNEFNKMDTVIVGSSLGGYLSMGYAVEHSQISGVFCSGCATDTSETKITAIGNKIFKPLTRFTHFNIFNILTDMLGAMKTFSNIEKITKLKESNKPVHLISGKYCFLRAKEKAARNLLGENYSIIPKSFHNVNISNADIFNNKLYSFIENIENNKNIEKPVLI